MVGGEYGRGFASCRTAKRVVCAGKRQGRGRQRRLSDRGAETEVVMLVMNKEGVNRLLSTQVHAGRRGQGGRGSGGPHRHSADGCRDDGGDPLVFTDARRVRGVSLTGATLREDDSANKDLYGKEMSNKTILTGGVPPPAGVRAIPGCHQEVLVEWR